MKRGPKVKTHILQVKQQCFRCKVKLTVDNACILKTRIGFASLCKNCNTLNAYLKKWRKQTNTTINIEMYRLSERLEILKRIKSNHKVNINQIK